MVCERPREHRLCVRKASFLLGADRDCNWGQILAARWEERNLFHLCMDGLPTRGRVGELGGRETKFM